MCGIFFSLIPSSGERSYSKDDAEVAMLLRRRGPDLAGCREGRLSSELSYHAAGHVLWMRGGAPTAQPAVTDSGQLLLWNGNVFDGLQVSAGVSDTAHLAALLSTADADTVPVILARLCGPFAFVLWQPDQRLLWFGRDSLGRRSLLWDASGGRLSIGLTLSSVAARHRPDLTEVPCVGLFRLHVPADCNTCESLSLQLHPWRHVPQCPWLSARLLTPLEAPAGMQVNRAMPEAAQAADFARGGDLREAMDITDMAAAVNDFEAAMLSAVQRRVTNMPPVCGNCLRPRTIEVGSVNICTRTPSNDSGNDSNGPVERDCDRDVRCSHAKLAVLFSGGVDSTLVAALADRCLASSEPVDLINVAFERLERTRGGGQTRNFEVPDRVTGRQSWRELMAAHPERRWNFVQVDVTAAELARWRAARVRHLLSPLETVLDDSIGCAVWFAARGSGCLLTEDGDGTPQPYTSPARVVLVGMGADEQLGGYGRHRSAFQRDGWSGLADEMQRQLLGICERNLGRDDRIISDHAREARFPFLDADVVRLLCSLPVWLKCQPGWSAGDKLPVRLLTARLGAPAAARLAKRAIQFGSRIAKLENRTEKAADVCGRLVKGDDSEGGDAPGARDAGTSGVRNEKGCGNRSDVLGDVNECAVCDKEQSVAKLELYSTG